LKWDFTKLSNSRRSTKKEGNFSCDEALIFKNRRNNIDAQDYNCMGKLMYYDNNEE
jgi:hypothetical protein